MKEDEANEMPRHITGFDNFSDCVSESRSSEMLMLGRLDNVLWGLLGSCCLLLGDRVGESGKGFVILSLRGERVGEPGNALRTFSVTGRAFGEGTKGLLAVPRRLADRAGDARNGFDCSLQVGRALGGGGTGSEGVSFGKLGALNDGDFGVDDGEKGFMGPLLRLRGDR